jgi:hypothetical protein
MGDAIAGSVGSTGGNSPAVVHITWQGNLWGWHLVHRGGQCSAANCRVITACHTVVLRWHSGSFQALCLTKSAKFWGSAQGRVEYCAAGMQGKLSASLDSVTTLTQIHDSIKADNKLFENISNYGHLGPRRTCPKKVTADSVHEMPPVAVRYTTFCLPV